MYIHGGGFALCNPKTHRPVTHAIASLSDSLMVVPDYRRIPEHCPSESLMDCLAVYEWLVDNTQGKQICLMGDSAGGALVVLLLCRIRELGLVLPECACVLSPWCDFTDPFPTPKGLCDYISHETLIIMGALVTARNQSNRSLNPMDLVAGIPGEVPLLIQAGEAETLADQIEEFTKKLKKFNHSKFVYQTYNDMIHVPHFFALVHSGGHDAILDVCRFVHSHTR